MIHPSIKFTMENEMNNKLNYLDLTINNEQTQLTFSIYRKPTTTDLIIHNESCHLYEHKKSAINFLINRINRYPITQESKDKESQIISTILENNKYKHVAMYPKRKQAPMTRGTLTQKWATFTYCGSSIRTITKLFRNTNIKVACRTTNTIKNLLKPKTIIKDIYDQSGVYRVVTIAH
jgi:hypothetical protein